MNKFQETGQRVCSATTQTGQPCGHAAEPGSSPPLCDLHGLVWLKKPDLPLEADYYGRYLAKWKSKGVLAQMDQRSLVRELLVARGLQDDLLEFLREPAADREVYKVFAPLILRVSKHICDVIKQLGSENSDEEWDGVLDRLGDELGIDI